MIGKTQEMRQVYRQIKQAAETDIPILLLGETGTGKDLAAQSIHRLSRRKDRTYRATNLGALSPELVASELFGYEKGAFTGAFETRKGLFEQTEDGTVFLDEIDAAEPKVQVSLLRLLEEKQFQRLCGTQPIKNRARLIAASNQNLEELMRNGAFRKDLFYRLDVFRIHLPPLRKRIGDLPLFVDEFLARFNQQFDKKIKRLDSDCLEVLEKYDWPGNVRELKNVLQRAIITCDRSTISLAHLPPRFLSCELQEKTVAFDMGTSLEEIEREMIVRTLAAVNNNRKKAAELLGISRRGIYKKLQKHHIE